MSLQRTLLFSLIISAGAFGCRRGGEGVQGSGTGGPTTGSAPAAISYDAAAGPTVTPPATTGMATDAGMGGGVDGGGAGDAGTSVDAGGYVDAGTGVRPGHGSGSAGSNVR